MFSDTKLHIFGGFCKGKCIFSVDFSRKYLPNNKSICLFSHQK